MLSLRENDHKSDAGRKPASVRPAARGVTVREEIHRDAGDKKRESNGRKRSTREGWVGGKSEEDTKSTKNTKKS